MYTASIIFQKCSRLRRAKSTHFPLYTGPTPKKSRLRRAKTTPCSGKSTGIARRRRDFFFGNLGLIQGEMPWIWPAAGAKILRSGIKICRHLSTISEQTFPKFSRRRRLEFVDSCLQFVDNCLQYFFSTEPVLQIFKCLQYLSCRKYKFRKL